MIPLELARLLSLLAFLVATSFGSYLFLREPRRDANRLFILILLCPFADDLLHLILPRIGLPAETIPSAAPAFLPVLSLHFLALVGRVAAPGRRLALLYALSTALFAAQWAHEQTLPPLLFAALVTLLSAPVASAALRRTQSRFERTRLRLIAAGLLAHLVYAAGAGEALVGGEGTPAWKLFAPAIPVALVGGPVLRLRLSNIWFVFRRGFAYGTALVLFVAAALLSLNELSSAPIPVDAVPPLGAALIVLFAVLFQPVMDRVRRAIDTLLFPGGPAFAETTARLARRLAPALLPEELRGVAADTLAEAFRIERLALLEGDDPARARYLSEPPPDAAARLAPLLAAYPLLARLAATPLHLDELEGETGAAEAALAAQRAGLTVAVAVPAESGPAWLLLLGGKGGNADYHDEDMQLLATVASQLSVSLKRAEAFAGLRESARRLADTVEELRRTQRELALRERLAVIGRMAATIAHEVRNPLGVMKVAAGTLGDRFASGSVERELSDFINLEVDKLNRVVSDLLDFTRDPEIRRRRAPLRPCVDAALAKVAAAAAGRVAFEVTEEPPGCAGWIHAEGIERLLVNLLLNAVEAAGSGTVRVRLERRDGATRIAVEDEGPGVDPDEAESLFEPFRTSREGGTGLGLAVCAKIAKAHGGAVRFDPGFRPGCRVTVDLPDPPPDEAAASEENA